MLEGAGDFPLVLIILNALAFIILVLTLGKGDDEFGQTCVAYKEAGRDYGKAGILAFSGQLAQFLLGEQKLAVALGFVIVV